MKKIKIDFILHWLWTIIFGLLLVSGLTLMGAKFGWITNYNVALSDYIHRTLAAAFVILTFIAIIMEAYRIGNHSKPMPWLFIKKTSVGIFTLISVLLFTLSGIFLWICIGFSHSTIAFAFMVHDLLTFIWVPVVIWHIFDKAHGLPMDLGVGKNVSKNMV